MEFKKGDKVMYLDPSTGISYITFVEEDTGAMLKIKNPFWTIKKNSKQYLVSFKINFVKLPKEDGTT